MKKERVVFFDYLRVLAIMAVIVLHVSAQQWTGLEGRDYEWQVFNVFNSITRWGVSVFLMISGSIFLKRDIEIKIIYKKYIPRMVVSYFLWSAVYAAFAPRCILVSDLKNTFDIKEFITTMFEGAVHLWFIPMIVGIYMCLPLIKQFVVSKKIMHYYLLLGFVFAHLVPQVVYIAKDFTSGYLQEVILSVNTLVSDMNIRIVMGFVYIFVLGYYLSETEFTKKQRNLIYILGVIGFLSTVLLNAFAGWKSNEISKNYLYTFTINVLLESIGVFVWFRYRKFNCEKLNAFVSKLSQYSFGAYLVHILIMSALRFYGFDSGSFNPLFCVPALSAVTIVLSFAVSFLLNKIPFLNKWIV